MRRLSSDAASPASDRPDYRAGLMGLREGDALTATGLEGSGRRSGGGHSLTGPSGGHSRASFWRVALGSGLHPSAGRVPVQYLDPMRGEGGDERGASALAYRPPVFGGVDRRKRYAARVC